MCSSDLGLAREQLHDGRDLALTTDFRAVFGEAVTRHLGAAEPERIFPGFTGTRRDWLGILRS